MSEQLLKLDPDNFAGAAALTRAKAALMQAYAHFLDAQATLTEGDPAVQIVQDVSERIREVGATLRKFNLSVGAR